MNEAENELRASKIGFPCIRNIWFGYIGIQEKFDKRVLRIFDLGNAIERLAVQWLREDGWNVDWNEGSQEAEQVSIIHIPDTDAIIAGHHDCIINKDGEFDGKPILVDIKSMNSRAYQHWLKGGTAENKLQYYVQANLYAHALGLEYAGIVGVNKDTSDYTIEVFPRDDKVVEATIEKAKMIVTTKVIPPAQAYPIEHLGVTSEVPKWCCGYCYFKKLGLCEGVEQ